MKKLKFINTLFLIVSGIATVLLYGIIIFDSPAADRMKGLLIGGKISGIILFISLMMNCLIAFYPLMKKERKEKTDDKD